MTPLRNLAYLTIGFGLIFVWRTVQAMIAEISFSGRPMTGFAFILVASGAAFSFWIIHSAISHLKSPGRATAMRLAKTASVSVFFLWSGLVRAFDTQEMVTTRSESGLAVACLVYFLVLRPAANKAFVSVEKHN